MSTASDTNNLQGSAYIHRGTDWLNAAPFFFKSDPNIPANEKNPQLHRYVARWHAGCTDHQGQTVWIRELPAHLQFRPGDWTLAHLRYDWNGGFTEKYGRICNFDPSLYSYDENSGTITSSGFIVAGKRFKVSEQGSQQLHADRPAMGNRIAWSPAMFHNKVVVRAGTGLYYDRGELFTHLSPGFAAGVIAGGPFGFNQAPPFVNSQVSGSTISPYQGFIPTCDPNQPLAVLRPHRGAAVSKLHPLAIRRTVRAGQRQQNH